MKNIILIFVIFTFQLFAQMTENPYLPLTQPFNQPPWNYNGNESVTAIPDSVVDWVLIELRGWYVESLNCQEVVYRRAGFVKVDGDIVSTDNDTIRYGTTFGDPRWENMPVDNTSGDYHMVIYQRNHIPVMTYYPIRFMDGYLSINYEFYKAENVWADTNGVVQVSDTIYAMIAGDTDKNGIINVLDYGPIQNGLFQTGYLDADCDNNGVVNVLDYAYVKFNLFKSNRLPKIFLRQEAYPTTITASSYVSPYTPDKTIDDFTTENPSADGWWQSQPGVPHWIQFEFNDSVYIEDIVINFCDRNNGVPRCSTEVSMNGIDWTQIQTSDQWLRFKWNYIDIKRFIKYLKITNYELNDPVSDFCIYEVDFYTYVQP